MSAVLSLRHKPPRLLSAGEDEGPVFPGRWVNSHELQAGDVITGRDGRPQIIRQIHQRYEESFPVSNLTIGDFHNYAVGVDSILVHNESLCDDGIERLNELVNQGAVRLEDAEYYALSFDNANEILKKLDDFRAPTTIPGDAGFIGPHKNSWTLTPQGAGAHLVERANVSGRSALRQFDQPGTPRFYPSGSPENAGAAHIRLHRATKNAGIKLRRGGNSNLSDAELLQRYRQAYSDPALRGIRGDVRTPDGSTVIGTDVTPSEALDLLLQWGG
ncbi:hypothetical protein Enr8_00020 [Blastopirellula retiformator]|uniref:Intein C-terminal splicing domain-containing protein n=2 Tax=Blastopirellula retiformator TaxID=2527970 RepID=A0A5C5VK39_9BACT|nr:hypothetical protein Enr8_00020 [Blastopirellula retiformator]